MTLRTLALTGVLVATSIPDGRGQSTVPPPQQGAVSGRVLDAVSGGPVVGAAVTVAVNQAGDRPSPAVRPRLPVLTDNDGRFAISNLPAGQIDVVVTARGYITQRYGMTRSSNAPAALELTVGGRVDGLIIRLWKPPVVTGELLDDGGDPVAGGAVAALRREIVGGRVRYSFAGGDSTDDRGMYRVQVTSPGSYLIAVITPTQTFAASTLDLIAEVRAGSREQQIALDRTLRASSPPLDFGPGYRIGDGFITLPPGGATLLPAPDIDGRLLRSRSTFYPAAAVPEQATVLTLDAGEVRSGINMRLGLEPTVSVSGTVLRPDGTPAAHVGVRLAREELDGFGTYEPMETAATITDAAGAFKMLGVHAGSYLLRIRIIPIPVAPGEEAEPVLTAMLRVVVGDNAVRDLSVRLAEAPRISGRVVFDGPSVPTAAQVARMSVEVHTVDTRHPSTPPVPRGAVSPAGDFRTTGITPGHYVVRTAGLPGWTIVSAVSAGKDVSDQPFEATKDLRDLVVTVSNQRAELTGVVRRENDAFDSRAVVIAFPANRDQPGVRRRQMASVSANGTYRIVGLPPGEYLIAAIEEQFASDWEDPSLLTLVSRFATKVTVLSKGSRTVDLRTSIVRRETP
jgi:hypothetical protein